MPRFLIDRHVPGAHELTADEQAQIAARSCSVLRDLGPDIQWLQSYVTEDRITCVYIAPSAALIREHAARGGFSCDRVSEIRSILDPTTSEIPAAAAQ